MLFKAVETVNDSNRCKSLLVPEGADDESDQPALLEPSQRQLWAECEKMTHLVQMERTFT